MLIKSSNYFDHSVILLCLLLVKQFGFKLNNIPNYIRKQINELSNYKNIFTIILITINNLRLYNQFRFDYIYDYYRKIDFLYDIQKKEIESLRLLRENICISLIRHDLTPESYEGFGL